MVKSYSSFYIVWLVFITSFMLISCAGNKADPYVVEEQDIAIQKSGKQKFAAWKQEELPGSPQKTNRAMKALLNQVDVFIFHNSWEQASGKLERVLRIDPTYAPAWSRLSWIALQNYSSGRAKQMAKRSNSYAKDNKELKILNWSFIRMAGQQKNDIETVRIAERMIEELEGS